ncbi:MAG: prolipoprotein diacylglyceryl transferase family protein, partial [Isosphaeraceae bacterium]
TTREGRPMHRIAISIPALGVTVYSFNVALAVACLAALGLTFWRARQVGIAASTVAGLAAWLLTGGFVGARVLYLLAHPETVHTPLDLIKVWEGGIVYYGCLIGGLIGSVIYWYRHPFPFVRMADVVAPALALGSAIGRVGCLLNGCCYGAVCHASWAIQFPAGSLPWARQVDQNLISPFAGHSLGLYPTQVLAIADGLLLLGLLTYLFPRRRRDGEIMAWLMVTYPVTRFLIECLRADEPRNIVGLTLSQAISVVVFGAGLVAWGLLFRSPPRATQLDDRSAFEPVEGRGIVVPKLASLPQRTVRHDGSQDLDPSPIAAAQ